MKRTRSPPDPGRRDGEHLRGRVYLGDVVRAQGPVVGDLLIKEMLKYWTPASTPALHGTACGGIAPMGSLIRFCVHELSNRGCPISTLTEVARQRNLSAPRRDRRTECEDRA